MFLYLTEYPRRRLCKNHWACTTTYKENSEFRTCTASSKVENWVGNQGPPTYGGN
jgi:hypothetical protein